MGLIKRLCNLFGLASTPEPAPAPEPTTIDGAPLPKSLTLAFTNAADHERVNRFFDPELKKHVDPKDYVVRRQDEYFLKAIDNGHTILLNDETGDAQTMTIAYHLHVDDDKISPDVPHDYTELGTSMARMPGFNSAKLAVAALAVKEWLNLPPQCHLVADIKKENIGSVKTYCDGLGWQLVDDPVDHENTHRASDRSIVNDADKGAGIPMADSLTRWYACNDKVIPQNAAVLLQFMDQGGLVNKRTGHRIPIDFSALDDFGATRERLEKLANGELSEFQPVPTPP